MEDLAQGLEMCSRAAIQVSGRLAWQGGPEEMREAGQERFYHRIVDGAR